MLGKLLKYDFRSMVKEFAFIWPAALALALVNHFTLYDPKSTAAAITILVYVSILAAMFVIAVIFVIQRFYKGLLGDEGYLMHTLPVRPWQLICSKLLCAIVTTFINVAVAVLSVFVIFPWDSADVQQLFRGLGYLFSHWNVQASNIALAAAEAVILELMSFAAGFLLLYLAMSIGHLFHKNRAALSVAAFIAISAVTNTLSSMALKTLLERFLYRSYGMEAYHLMVWSIIAGEAVLSALCYAGTEFILRKRLNLE